MGSGIAGSINPSCNTQLNNCTPTGSTGYGTAFDHAFNNSAPDKGIGFNINIPIRNRTAQADQARSLIEYRQSELRLEQLYTQIRMQVVNAQFALTNDRAQVVASIAAQDFAQQSLDAEEKKLRLGASTTANVLQQQRNLAGAENNLIAAQGAYARDRAGLYQIMAQHPPPLRHQPDGCGIRRSEGRARRPGLKPAEKGLEPTTVPPASR